MENCLLFCVLGSLSRPTTLPQDAPTYLPCLGFEDELEDPLGFSSARGWFLLFEDTCLSLLVDAMLGSSAELRPCLYSFTSWGDCRKRRIYTTRVRGNRNTDTVLAHRSMIEGTPWWTWLCGPASALPECYRGEEKVDSWSYLHSITQIPARPVTRHAATLCPVSLSPVQYRTRLHHWW